MFMDIYDVPGDDSGDITNAIIGIAAFGGFIAACVGFLYMQEQSTDTHVLFRENRERY